MKPIIKLIPELNDNLSVLYFVSEVGSKLLPQEIEFKYLGVFLMTDSKEE